MADTPVQNPSVETLDSDAADLAALLPGSVESAPPNLKGFDTNTRVLATVATTLATVLGYKYAIRYVSRGPTQPGSTGLLCVIYGV